MKAIAVALGAAAGALLAVVTWQVWLSWHRGAATLTGDQRQQLRRMFDENPTAIFAYDEATSYRYKPGFHGYRVRPTHLGARNNKVFAHVTNSLGLLGEAEVNRETAVPKILLLGDSVTYGVWVDADDAFPARVQRLAGASCQLLVGACEGWSTKQEIAFYDAYLRDVPWQDVVIVFCLNDLVDFEWTWGSGARPQLSEEVLTVGNGGTRTNDTFGGLKLAALKLKFQSSPDTAPLAAQTNSSLWAWDDDRWDHYLAHTLGPFVARRDRPHLSIVMAPTLAQLRALTREAPLTIALHPQLRLSAYCEQTHITCIDLAEAFAGLTLEQLDPLFLDDLHFSERGHELVAQFLWPRLRLLLAPVG